MSISGRPSRGRVAALAVLVVLLAALWAGPVSAYLDHARKRHRGKAR